MSRRYISDYGFYTPSGTYNMFNGRLGVPSGIETPPIWASGQIFFQPEEQRVLITSGTKWLFIDV